jgi:hypothetical protein
VTRKPARTKQQDPCVRTPKTVGTELCCQSASPVARAPALLRERQPCCESASPVARAPLKGAVARTCQCASDMAWAETLRTEC